MTLSFLTAMSSSVTNPLTLRKNESQHSTTYETGRLKYYIIRLSGRVLLLDRVTSSAPDPEYLRAVPALELPLQRIVLLLGLCRELAPLVVDQFARYLRVAILDSRL